MAYLVDISELAAGRTVPVIDLELRPFLRCSLELFRDRLSIIRMNALQSCFERQHLALRIKTQYAKAFLGHIRGFSLWRDHMPNCQYD